MENQDQHQEIWRTLNDYPGYTFSNTGKAFSFKSNRSIGGRSGNGYMCVTLTKPDGDHKTLLLSRIIYKLFGNHPELLDEKEIDHIDRDPTNNHIINLRLTTSKQNEANKSKQSTYGKRQCSSQYVGVHWQKQAQKWQAKIYVGKYFGLGLYKSERNAGYVYNRVASTFKSPEHWLNTLPDDFELPTQEENREFKISQTITKINHYLNN